MPRGFERGMSLVARAAGCHASQLWARHAARIAPGRATDDRPPGDLRENPVAREDGQDTTGMGDAAYGCCGQALTRFTGRPPDGPDRLPAPRDGAAS